MEQQTATASISTIAAALGVTVQALHKRSKRQSWQPTGERTQGGGETYLVATLPLKKKELSTLKRHLERKNGIVVPFVPAAADEAAERERLRLEARAQSLEKFGRLPEWQRRGANAKLEIIQASERFIIDKKLARAAGQDLFCHEFNLGRVDHAQAVLAEIRHLHPSTLRAWVKAEYEQGMMGLVDGYGNRKGKSKIETYCLLDAAGRPVMKANEKGEPEPVKPYVDALLAIMTLEPHVEPKKAQEYMMGTCPGGPEVSIKSVDRWMRAWKDANPQKWAWICNPDRAKGTYKISFGVAAEGVEGPNQRWECDATPADLLLTDGRYKVLGIIDVGPRRGVLKVSKTERAIDNIGLIQDRLLTWGVPHGGTIVTDNGSAYTAEHFKRSLRELEVHQHICKPFASEEKPFIERFFCTFSHDLVEHMPGYSGHSVADRKDIESRASFAKRLMKRGEVIEIKMSSAELQAFCDRWLNIYHNTEHSTLGKSPNQAVAEWPHAIHRIADPRALDVLFSPVAGKDGWRTITKEGFDIDTFNYIHESFGLHAGKRVRCLETADVGKVVVQLPSEQGVMEFLCIAECPEITGISRAEVTAKGQALQKQLKEEVNKLRKQAKKHFGGRSSGEIIMAVREERIAAQMKTVTHFPRPTVNYTTPGLQAAAEAAAVLDGRQSAPQVSPAAIAAREKLQAEIAKPKTEVFEIPFDDPGKYKLWCELDGQIAGGIDISEAALKFYNAYKNQPYYKIRKGIDDDIYSLRK